MPLWNVVQQPWRGRAKSFGTTLAIYAANTGQLKQELLVSSVSFTPIL